MAQTADFYGIDFEVEYSLFADEFESVPGIYVVYTSKICLEIGESEDIKMSLETNEHTRDWINLSDKQDILVAIHLDPDKNSREDKVLHLKARMKPKF